MIYTWNTARREWIIHDPEESDFNNICTYVVAASEKDASEAYQSGDSWGGEPKPEVLIRMYDKMVERLTKYKPGNPFEAGPRVDGKIRYADIPAIPIKKEVKQMAVHCPYCNYTFGRPSNEGKEDQIVCENCAAKSPKFVKTIPHGWWSPKQKEKPVSYRLVPHTAWGAVERHKAFGVGEQPQPVPREIPVKKVVKIVEEDQF